MDRLKICGRDQIPRFANRGFTHMISIGESDGVLDGLRLPEIAEEHHLCLRFKDTSDPDHPDAPLHENLSPLFGWLRGVEVVRGLLVHCTAGVSRSPAVAVIALCAMEPHRDPDVHMALVEASTESKRIWPNSLVVQTGDQLLAREGAIIASVEKWKTIRSDALLG